MKGENKQQKAIKTTRKTHVQILFYRGVNDWREMSLNTRKKHSSVVGKCIYLDYLRNTCAYMTCLIRVYDGRLYLILSNAICLISSASLWLSFTTECCSWRVVTDFKKQNNYKLDIWLLLLRISWLMVIQKRLGRFMLASVYVWKTW